MSLDQRVLVIGGGGRTGRRVADLLMTQGHQVIVAGRRSRGPGTVVVDLGAGVDSALLADVDGVVVSVEPPADSAGADAVLNKGLADLAEKAAKVGVRIVLVSQIYVTRADEHPEMAGIIRARAAGEQALRDSGAPYAIVRPSWLTDGAAGGVRLEQGDTGDGRISRDAVAQATVAALFSEAALGKTFELYDSEGTAPDWHDAFSQLTPDVS